MKRWLAALIVLAAVPAAAEGIYFSIPVTSDLSVGGTATKEVALPKAADWIYIRNHCSTALRFRINPLRGQSTTQDFPLRLGTNEVFVVPLRVYSVGVSNDSSSTCYFTIQAGGR